jgi:hypothetical protein
MPMTAPSPWLSREALHQLSTAKTTSTGKHPTSSPALLLDHIPFMCAKAQHWHAQRSRFSISMLMAWRLTSQQRLQMNQSPARKMARSILQSPDPERHSPTARTMAAPTSHLMFFTGLAPGNYVIVVKDSGDATKAKTVTVGAGTVVFDKIYFSKNPIEYKRFSTSANYNKDNYKIHIDAQYEAIPDSGNFSHLMYASKAPLSVLTANQPVSFNIAPAFRGLFTPNPPEKNAAAILRLTDRIKFYKINYGDIYEQLESPASTTPSNPFLVMYGGLSKKKYSEIDYFYNYLPTNKKFMTWAPLVKDVDYNQEDYLQFWCYDLAVSTAKLMIKAYFDDDTNETDQITSLKVTYGHLLQIPAGPLNSGAIGINPAKNLKYYDLWLADQNDAVISEVRTYKITEFKHPRTRYYLFLNSLGGYEVLRTVGFSEQSIEISREVIERFYGFGTYTTFGQYMAGEATKRKGTEVSSGFFSGSLSKKWLDYMQEPAMSRFVFDITDGTRVPLINMTKEAIIARNEDNKRFVRFEFLDAFADQSYTPYDIA